MEGWRQRRLGSTGKNLHQGGKRKNDRKRKTDLTLTGLLMEGTDTEAVAPDFLFYLFCGGGSRFRLERTQRLFIRWEGHARNFDFCFLLLLNVRAIRA